MALLQRSQHCMITDDWHKCMQILSFCMQMDDGGAGSHPACEQYSASTLTCTNYGCQFFADAGVCTGGSHNQCDIMLHYS